MHKQGQLTTLGHLATNMLNFDKTLTNTLAGIAASNVVTTELTSQVLAIVTESTAARNSIEKSLLDFVNRLDSVAATSNINRIVACLDTNALTSQTASALIASKIDGVVVADVQVADALGALGQEASLALEKFSLKIFLMYGDLLTHQSCIVLIFSLIDNINFLPITLLNKNIILIFLLIFII